jgi:hypothetical protein
VEHTRIHQDRTVRDIRNPQEACDPSAMKMEAGGGGMGGTDDSSTDNVDCKGMWKILLII